MSEAGPGPGGGERPPTEEELRAAMEEQLRRVKVDDVLLQTAVTLVNLGARRLGLAGTEDEKDLEQAKLAIDALRALWPLLPQEDVAPLKDALAQLQMAYAREVEPGKEEPGPDQPAAPEAEGEAAQPGDADRAKARSKIWTPPGA
jgi:hypothetical protein